MQQKYAYAFNGVFNWFRGVIALPSGRSRPVTAAQSAGRTLLWRNHFTQGYKVSEAYAQQPMDLSNLLFVRTREHLLLSNKVRAPKNVLSSGKANILTGSVTEKSLAMLSAELESTLPTLANMLNVLAPAEGKAIPDLPVAFATNTLYVLERNGLGSAVRDTYDSLLIPVLKAKAEYLHAEGVAQAVWALASAGLVEDRALWATLKEAVLKKDFTPLLVKNERWSATLFSTHSGNEHFFQSELTEFADQLFFQEGLSLFEVYNGLRRAH